MKKVQLKKIDRRSENPDEIVSENGIDVTGRRNVVRHTVGYQLFTGNLSYLERKKPLDYVEDPWRMTS